MESLTSKFKIDVLIQVKKNVDKKFKCGHPLNSTKTYDNINR